ncbi:MAG: hypothetical protein II809_01890, partial [Bacteroidales bacterium]|nr:hypothetical protein [Bacteroidales bacterium]
LGNKYYRIPYRWGVTALLILFGLGVWGISLLLPEMSLWPKLAVHTLLIVAYLAVVGAMIMLSRRARKA